MNWLWGFPLEGIEDLEASSEELAVRVKGLRGQLKESNVLFTLGRIGDSTYSEILNEIEGQVNSVRTVASQGYELALKLLDKLPQHHEDLDGRIERLTARYRVGLIPNEKYSEELTGLMEEKKGRERLRHLVDQFAAWKELRLVHPDRRAVTQAYERLLESFNSSWGTKRGQKMLELEIQKCMKAQRRSRDYVILQLAYSRGLARGGLALLT